MHPLDAEARGLGAATRVQVLNDLGAVILPLQVTEAIAARRRFIGEGRVAGDQPAPAQTISALVSADEKADLAEGACFNDTGVEVEAA